MGSRGRQIRDGPAPNLATHARAYRTQSPTARGCFQRNTYNYGIIKSKIKKNANDENKVYDMYYDYQERVKFIKPHRILALNRGENEGILSVSIDNDRDRVIEYINKRVIKNDKSFVVDIVKEAIEDSYKRLIEPSIEREIRSDLTELGEEAAINNFGKNLESLLLTKNIKTFNDIKIGNNYKAIFICTSLKHKRIFVLPHDLKLLNINPDNFPIAKAVIMSCSIPFFYEPYKLNNEYFYDGGISDNYPLWCFTKGIALKLSNEKNYQKIFRENIFGKINNYNDIKEIYINTNGYSATDFKKGFNNRYDLYKRGYYAIKNFLNLSKDD